MARTDEGRCSHLCRSTAESGKEPTVHRQETIELCTEVHEGTSHRNSLQETPRETETVGDKYSFDQSLLLALNIFPL